MRIAPLVAAVCLLAVPVAAQDACLTGASTLPDQRQLASLRTATEAACPCAGFTSRGDYQKCARDALRAALDASDLRPECKRTATNVNRGAVCGSTKVACGRYMPAAATPISCRVKRTTACEDTSRYESTACDNETHCADVVDWTAGTCVDTRTNGPYVPGIRIINFTKTSAT